jgi:2-polyprenyl-3-methyl-5-hydroxy-6-metoxy-1,4-benzoquinol methylase
MCSFGTSVERLARQIAFFAQFVPAQANILEIGCATGELAAATRAALLPERYDAIELSPAGEVARNHVDHLFSKPLGALSASDGLVLYDLIIMSHVLEHIEDPASEIDVMKRFLKPNGLMFLEVPNGSGNRKLAIDDNSSHLHFFSPTSLSRLLASHGLEVIATATDVPIDARYTDSLQVITKQFALPKWSPHYLSNHPALAAEGEIVVWGAGSLVEEVLANFFDPARIAFFVDRDKSKQGKEFLGRPVRAPESLGDSCYTILANSIDYGPAIAADIAHLFPDVRHKVIQMSDLIG